MTRWVGWCFLLLLTANIAYGITALPAAKVFYMPTGGGAFEPYLELYWQVDPTSVGFAKDDKGIFTAKIITKLEVTHETQGIIKQESFYLQTTPASSLQAAVRQNIMDLHRFAVTPGKVKYTLSMWQEGNTAGGFVYSDSLEIQKAHTPSYSNLQLLDTAYTFKSGENVFVKNGNLQVPKCIDFLDDNRSLLHYYFELYGTDKLSKDDMAVQRISISRKEYEYTVYELERNDTLKPAEVIPVQGSFNIAVLPSGNYYLNVYLYNGKGGELTKKSLFFQRSNSTPVAFKPSTMQSDSAGPVFEKVQVFDVSETFVKKYTMPQLKAIMKMLKPIATEPELVNIEGFDKKPEEIFMRYFVYNFWKTRSPLDPEKGWEDFTKLVREVNREFGSSSRPGYETERGFYFLKYGPPDQRFTVNSEEGTIPYEIWQYNAPGKQSSPGAFLFYNPGYMVTDYKLLHSTVIGEMRNTNWRAELYKNGGVSVNNNNSRAEQVFTNR